MFALKSQETRIDVGEQFIANLCLSERRKYTKRSREVLLVFFSLIIVDSSSHGKN